MDATHTIGGGHTYAVTGGWSYPSPGGLAPDELDGRAEWREAGPDLLDQVWLRIGSEVNVQKVLLAVLGPLRRALAGEPLEAILARLPRRCARELAEVEWNLAAPVPAADGAQDYLATVARLVQLPPRLAAAQVVGVLGAVRAVLDPAAAARVAERLPPDLAELWRAAR